MMKKKDTKSAAESEIKTKSADEEVKQEISDDQNSDGSSERREMERRGGDRRQDDRDGSEDRRMKERRDKIKNISESVNEGEGSTEQKNDDLNKEISDLKELLQRRQADFENYKKRVLKQQEDQRKFAVKDIALDIIKINDDLHRAIEASSDIPNGESIDEAHKSFVEGVTLISNRIEDTLRKYGVVEIESLGKSFDPNFHEAVEINESPVVEEDTVTKIYQKGFCIDDIVLRSTKVRVSRPGKGNSNSDEAGTSDEEKK